MEVLLQGLDSELWKTGLIPYSPLNPQQLPERLKHVLNKCPFLTITTSLKDKLKGIQRLIFHPI